MRTQNILSIRDIASAMSFVYAGLVIRRCEKCKIRKLFKYPPLSKSQEVKNREVFAKRGV